MRRRIILTLAALLLGGATATAQTAQQMEEKKAITYQDIARGEFYARSIAGLRSMNDGEHFSAFSNDRGAIVRYRYSDGEAVDTIYFRDKVKADLPLSSYSFSNDENLIMFTSKVEPIYRHSFKSDYWFYNRTTGEIKQLSPNGKQQIATFSPDGTKAAFVRDNNLFVVDLATGKETQLTVDGKKGAVINGLSDWVYEEEYAFDRAYEWNTTSDAIAYYRFDQSNVKSYSMPVYGGKLYPEDQSFKYPKAGEENSSVSIRVYDLNIGTYSVVDEVTPSKDGYFPHIEWTGRNDELAIHKVNRLQNHYELYLYNKSIKSLTLLYSESSERYIDRIDGSKVKFLPKVNRFILTSEADGYRHLYMYSMAGEYIDQLTVGDWEVTSLDAVDLRRGKIYFTAARRSPLDREPYVAKINRKGKVTSIDKLQSVDQIDGTYNVAFSKGAKFYVQTYSSAKVPTITTVHDAKNGKVLRTIEDNAKLVENLEKFAMPRKEFTTFKAADGKTDLNGYVLYPANFDKSKKYPVLMTQYSGPGSQSVVNSWGYSWETALLDKGFLVVCVDGRGTGFRGFDFRSCTYGDLGNLEVQDQIATAKQLAELDYVNKDKIAIYGWSFGGFMSLNCILKGADVFWSAISVAPVTSWRYYDTIYTEIYNGLPQDNADGYDKNSPLHYAKNLKGRLLLAHGTADDNVHIQNAFDMMTELNKYGKEYEMKIYPDQNHGMGSDRHNLLLRAIDFLVEGL